MSTRNQIDALLALIKDAAHKALDEYEKYGQEAPSLDALNDHPLDLEQNIVNFKKTISQLEGACEQLCTVLAPPDHTISKRAQEYSWTCLRVAARMGFSDELVNYPDGLHVRDLSAKVNIPPTKLATIMRVLASRHCFREVAEDIFANNRLSLTLLSSRPSSSFVDLLTLEGQEAAVGFEEYLNDPEYCQSWDPALSVYMRTVKDEGHKVSFYEWLQLKEDRRAVLGRSMISMNKVIGSLCALHAYPWDTVKTMCDVGSGVGSFTRILLKQVPTIHATLFDLPDTVALAKKDWGDDFSSRVTYIGGNFFEELPVKDCDVYYLRNVIHNWPDDKALQILKTIRAAVKPQSRVLIHDYIMRHMHPESRNDGLETAPEPMLPNYGAGNIQLYHQDLTMLFMYNSKERTTRELGEMARSAGFHLDKVWDLGNMCLLDLTPV